MAASQPLTPVTCSFGADPGATVPDSPYLPPILQATLPLTDASNMQAWITLLASQKLKGRRAGSRESRGVAALLAAQLAAFGWEPVLPRQDYCQTFASLIAMDQNVVARLPGRATKGKAVRDFIILGAHYDHLGQVGSDIYPGADDNASGVAALLEIARVLPSQRPNIDIIIVFFGAEEPGLLGSRFFEKHPPVPLGRLKLMINVDQVGRQLLDGHALRRILAIRQDSIGYVYSQRGALDSERLIQEASAKTGTPIIGIPNSLLLKLGYCSDHESFTAHAPTLFLSTSIHNDYHKPSDTADKIDSGQTKRASDLVLSVLGGF